MTADIVGWDIGGAHVKACRLVAGRVIDVRQWACPLWQGLHHLTQVLDGARAAWPGLATAHHAVTMTGEMADFFADREDGVRRIADTVAAALAPDDAAAGRLHFFAGDAGWASAQAAARHWAHIASANWLASARHTAQALPAAEGLLVDIGSTTTDVIAFRHGRVLTTARSDADRLASGELVYHGVVRTPLCALARRVPWRGRTLNVMNEWFATTADLYRLTGELDPAHDQHPSADQGAKTLPASRQRLARMIGGDARDGSSDDWLQLARAWRDEQVAELQGQLQRVLQDHGLGPRPWLVTAGCGDFLVPDIAGPGARVARYADAVARLAPRAAADTARWAQVCAPSVAVAALLHAVQQPRQPAAPPPRSATEETA